MERTFGDASVKKRYSHIDLVYMVDGVDMQKGTVTAGNRCYYLKVNAGPLVSGASTHPHRRTSLRSTNEERGYVL